MKKVYLDNERCFGCGSCWSLAPDNFTCDDEGRTSLISDKVTESTIDASECCPASAIIIKDECNCGDDCHCKDDCHCDENCDCNCK